MFDDRDDDFDDGERIDAGLSMEMVERVMKLAQLLQANICTRQEVFRHLAPQYRIDPVASEDGKRLRAASRMLERDLKFLEEEGYVLERTRGNGRRVSYHLTPGSGPRMPFLFSEREVDMLVLLYTLFADSTQYRRSDPHQPLPPPAPHNPGSQRQDVDVVAKMAMGAPGAFLPDPPLLLSREVAASAHEAKRRLLFHPGKPLRRLWLKREQAALGTDHDIVPILAVLHARGDLNRLLGCFGRESRACRLGCALGGPAGLGGSRRRRRLRALLEQVGESLHLLVQGGELGLQGKTLLSMPRRRAAWATDTQVIAALLSGSGCTRNESEPGELRGLFSGVLPGLFLRR